ncbi:MFS transporter [Kordiimonas gwangyangensis]|uniref:MFS transporter n=1 Tax=Kordiimonas gwangyangensis TaxID=288022 RepID=UPI0003731E97|nr:MFS transporter [Kordiimonas gwangyangensis]
MTAEDTTMTAEARTDATTAQTAAEQPTKPNSSFFWLMLSGFISMVGDQFTLIGLPWLTLKLTGDPMALGLVLAVVGIPRAAFILLGGAIVDRYSPKSVLIWSKYVNTALLGALAALVYMGALTLPLLYILAAAIGLASAFAYPAGSSMLPFVVPREKLAQANGLMMGMRQVTFFIGPLIAGFVIALFGADGLNSPGLNGGVVAESELAAEATGLAIVFAFDALTFFLSAVMLIAVHLRPDAKGPAGDTAPTGVIKLMFEGIMNILKDGELRALFTYMALIQILVVGPMQVGLPVFAESRLDGGAASFGTIMASHGAGVLAGVIIAGAGVKFGFSTLGRTFLTVDIFIGLAVAAFAFVHSTLAGGALMFGAGILGGIIQVKIISWIQGRTPPAQMGRMMSFFMFIVMGMAPIAASVAGWLLTEVEIVTFFLICGVALSIVAASALLIRPMRDVGAGA